MTPLPPWTRRLSARATDAHLGYVTGKVFKLALRRFGPGVGEGWLRAAAELTEVRHV